MISITDKEKALLTILKELLKDNFPRANYQVGGYLEDAVCIEKKSDGIWEVYIGYRGRHDIYCEDKSLSSACVMMLWELSCDDEKLFDELKEEFFNKIPSGIAEPLDDKELDNLLRCPMSSVGENEKTEEIKYFR